MWSFKDLSPASVVNTEFLVEAFVLLKKKEAYLRQFLKPDEAIDPPVCSPFGENLQAPSPSPFARRPNPGLSPPCSARPKTEQDSPSALAGLLSDSPSKNRKPALERQFRPKEDNLNSSGLPPPISDPTLPSKPQAPTPPKPAAVLLNEPSPHCEGNVFPPLAVLEFKMWRSDLEFMVE
ncbi:hypothetical protein M5K25_010721 [Dendrobium thyrsiflorum]|uniref:Uncharacterized protein n=1 Tax=Dendrobium thyrsiflorum TaxID=117978 RepID=A0ABD0V1Z7_DENTH